MRLVDIECSEVTEVLYRRAFTSRADIQEFLDNIPTADAELIKHGKWIDVPDYGGNGWQIAGKPVQPKQCSICGDVYSKAYNYCPRCGARMKEK